MDIFIILSLSISMIFGQPIQNIFVSRANKSSDTLQAATNFRKNRVALSLVQDIFNIADAKNEFEALVIYFLTEINDKKTKYEFIRGILQNINSTDFYPSYNDSIACLNKIDPLFKEMAETIASVSHRQKGLYIKQDKEWANIPSVHDEQFNYYMCNIALAKDIKLNDGISAKRDDIKDLPPKPRDPSILNQATLWYNEIIQNGIDASNNGNPLYEIMGEFGGGFKTIFKEPFHKVKIATRPETSKETVHLQLEKKDKDIEIKDIIEEKEEMLGTEIVVEMQEDLAWDEMKTNIRKKFGCNRNIRAYLIDDKKEELVNDLNNLTENERRLDYNNIEKVVVIQKLNNKTVLFRDWNGIPKNVIYENLLMDYNSGKAKTKTNLLPTRIFRKTNGTNKIFISVNGEIFGALPVKNNLKDTDIIIELGAPTKYGSARNTDSLAITESLLIRLTEKAFELIENGPNDYAELSSILKMLLYFETNKKNDPIHGSIKKTIEEIQEKGCPEIRKREEARFKDIKDNKEIILLPDTLTNKLNLTGHIIYLDKNFFGREWIKTVPGIEVVENASSKNGYLAYAADFNVKELDIELDNKIVILNKYYLINETRMRWLKGSLELYHGAELLWQRDNRVKVILHVPSNDDLTNKKTENPIAASPVAATTLQNSPTNQTEKNDIKAKRLVEKALKTVPEKRYKKNAALLEEDTKFLYYMINLERTPGNNMEDIEIKLLENVRRGVLDLKTEFALSQNLLYRFNINKNIYKTKRAYNNLYVLTKNNTPASKHYKTIEMKSGTVLQDQLFTKAQTKKDTWVLLQNGRNITKEYKEVDIESAIVCEDTLFSKAKTLNGNYIILKNGKELGHEHKTIKLSGAIIHNGHIYTIAKTKENDAVLLKDGEILGQRYIDLANMVRKDNDIYATGRLHTSKNSVLTKNGSPFVQKCCHYNTSNLLRCSNDIYLPVLTSLEGTSFTQHYSILKNNTIMESNHMIRNPLLKKAGDNIYVVGVTNKNKRILLKTSDMLLMPSSAEYYYINLDKSKIFNNQLYTIAQKEKNGRYVILKNGTELNGEYPSIDDFIVHENDVYVIVTKDTIAPQKNIGRNKTDFSRKEFVLKQNGKTIRGPYDASTEYALEACGRDIYFMIKNQEGKFSIDKNKKSVYTKEAVTRFTNYKVNNSLYTILKSASGDTILKNGKQIEEEYQFIIPESINKKNDAFYCIAYTKDNHYIMLKDGQQQGDEYQGTIRTENPKKYTEKTNWELFKNITNPGQLFKSSGHIITATYTRNNNYHHPALAPPSDPRDMVLVSKENPLYLNLWEEILVKNIDHCDGYYIYLKPRYEPFSKHSKPVTRAYRYKLIDIKNKITDYELKIVNQFLATYKFPNKEAKTQYRKIIAEYGNLNLPTKIFSKHGIHRTIALLGAGDMVNKWFKNKRVMNTILKNDNNNYIESYLKLFNELKGVTDQDLITRILERWDLWYTYDSEGVNRFIDQIQGNGCFIDKEHPLKSDRRLRFLIDKDIKVLEDDNEDDILNKEYINIKKPNLSVLYLDFDTEHLNKKRKKDGVYNLDQFHEDLISLKDYNIESKKSKLRSIVKNQTPTKTTMFREIAGQNAIDAGAKNVRIKEHLRRREGKLEKVLSIEDDGCGMSLETIRKHFLTIGNSNKDNDPKKIGKFGTGSKTRYYLGERIETYTGDGSGLSYLIIERVIKDSEGNVIDVILEEEREFADNYKGTKTNIIIPCPKEKLIPIQIKALSTESSIRKSLGGAISNYSEYKNEKEVPPVLNVSFKNKQIKDHRELIAEFKIDGHKDSFKLYRTSNYSRTVEQEYLYVNDLTKNYFDYLLNETLKLLNLNNLVFEAPSDIPIDNARGGFIKAMPLIKKSLFVCVLKSLIGLYIRKEIDLPDLPYDFFRKTSNHYKIDPEVQKDAEKINKGLIDNILFEKYIQNPGLIGDLFISLQKIICGEAITIKEIEVKARNGETLPKALSPELEEYIMSERNDATQHNTPKGVAPYIKEGIKEELMRYFVRWLREKTGVGFKDIEFKNYIPQEDEEVKAWRGVPTLTADNKLAWDMGCNLNDPAMQKYLDTFVNTLYKDNRLNALLGNDNNFFHIITHEFAHCLELEAKLKYQIKKLDDFLNIYTNHPNYAQLKKETENLKLLYKKYFVDILKKKNNPDNNFIITLQKLAGSITMKFAPKSQGPLKTQIDNALENLKDITGPSPRRESILEEVSEYDWHTQLLSGLTHNNAFKKYMEKAYKDLVFKDIEQNPEVFEYMETISEIMRKTRDFNHKIKSTKDYIIEEIHDWKNYKNKAEVLEAIKTINASRNLSTCDQDVKKALEQGSFCYLVRATNQNKQIIAYSIGEWTSWEGRYNHNYVALIASLKQENKEKKAKPKLPKKRKITPACYLSEFIILPDLETVTFHVAKDNAGGQWYYNNLKERGVVDMRRKLDDRNPIGEAPDSWNYTLRYKKFSLSGFMLTIIQEFLTRGDYDKTLKLPILLKGAEALHEAV